MSDEPAPFEMIELLTKREVAARMRISERTLDRLTDAGDGPTVTRIGRRVLFRRDHVETWVRSLADDHNANGSAP